MTLFNAAMDSAFDVLLSPFRRMPPIVGLSVVSLVTAMFVLLVFRATSDQRRIAEVKRRIAAALFEIRLFNDDLPAVFRAQRDLLRQNATYLRLSLAPLLWTIVPLALIVSQLELHYGYRGLTLGQPALLTVLVREGTTADAIRGAALEAPPQVSVLTPPEWFPVSNEVVWRIRPESAGAYELRARIGGETFTKSVDASGGVVRRSPVRVAGGFWRQLTNPAERPIPDGAAVKAISVQYVTRGVPIFGAEWNWLLVFFVASTIFALLLKKPLRVTA